MDNTNKKPKEWKDVSKGNKIGCLFTLILIIAIVVIAIIISKNTPDTPQTTDRDKAFTVAKQFVKQQLIDPESAEFLEQNTKAAEYKDSSYVYRGYVKATNKLGLVAPMEYNIGVKWNGGDGFNPDNYTLKFINFP
ncbi:MAG: hypothetical protein H7289_07775 [Mucilaginibacter sp.]|nr:hypothetical protein [Mucilaginibacter sp.]